jgi:glyoxylase I family protein
MKTFHHLALNCRDRNASEQFYAKHFGFRRVRVFYEGTANEFVMLRQENACLELFSSKPENRTLTGQEQPVGFTHFCFEVDDMESAVAELEADGIETEGIVDASGILEGLQVCFFKDPDGNRLEFLKGYRDQ